MKQKLKIHDPIPQGIASGEPGGDGLAEAQQQLNDLLSASDDAIDAALSENSEAFIASIPRQGGQ